MEPRKFKLQYFSRTARYLHSVKSVDTPAIGTFISTPHAKMTPDPPIASKCTVVWIHHVVPLVTLLFQFDSKSGFF